MINCSDEPLCSPSDVQYHLKAEGIGKITEWMKVAVARAVCEYLPMFHSCRRHIR